MLNLNDWFELEDFRRYKLFIIGGTVRDILMGQAPKDIDVVCKNAKDLANKIKGEKNVALIPMEKKPDEPCYRIVKREMPEYVLDIAELRGETIEEDLNKRDFTINAIAIEVKEDGSLGDMIDPLNGAEDIKKRIIRVTNSNAFVNDPLRILRAIRFSSMLNFSIDNKTYIQMRNHVKLLEKVAPERIITEIFFILKNKNSTVYFRQMDDLGILDVIFPEIIPMKGCNQNRFHHLDVWYHSLLTMEKCEELINNLSYFFGKESIYISDYLQKDSRAELLKLSALFHDIGKPHTYSKNPDTGRITFYRHPEKGAEVAEKMAQRLKISNKNRNFLCLMVSEHLNILNLYSNGKTGYELIKWIKTISDELPSIIILSIADIMSALGPESTELKRKGYIKWATQLMHNYYGELKDRFKERSLITGDDLMSLGIPEGPFIGKILSEIRLLQDSGKIKSREDAIKEAERLYVRFSKSEKNPLKA